MSDSLNEEIAAERRRDRLCDEFERGWIAGHRPQIEDSLAAEPEPSRDELLALLLRLELHYRRQLLENPTADEYVARFPKFQPAILDVFAHTSTVHKPKSGPARPASRFGAGDMIAGRYRIVAALGKGGMGEVYRADDLELGEPVALKFLPSERAADPEWVTRLKQEVALARRVTEKHVCRVHDLGDAEGLPFLVMEYVDGESLESLRRKVRRIDPAAVNAFARQLCDGLTAVHDVGLLHRDLKPANVLIDGTGRLLLADFGLAAAVAKVDAGEVGLGTVSYMAPEQLRAETVTARSDLFSLGLILYEMTTGTRPFPGTTRGELRRQHMELTPRRPAEVVAGLDPSLDRAIMWCLERDPSKRPATALDVKNALPPLSPEETGKQGGTGKLRPAVALGVLFAALIGLFVNAQLSDRTMAFRQIGTVKDPNYLREQAVNVAASLGYETARPGTNGTLEWDIDLVRSATRQRPPHWPDSTEAGSAPLYYWYRASPFPMVPMYRVTPADPPMNVPGMVCVMLDGQGRLIEFHAVPERSPQSRRVEDWEAKLLAAAGLNPADFRRTPTVRRPPVFADELWSLEHKEKPGTRIDVALCDGRPVYFRIGEPLPGDTDRPDRVSGEGFTSQLNRQLVAGPVGMVILLCALALAIPVTLRNLRLGRCDLQSALRVAAVYLACVLSGWLLTANHTLSLDAERGQLMNQFGLAAFWGLVLIVVYLALEPYMRRRWPERLSSWNRLLSGRLRDPLVGRDILFGVAIGTLFALVPKATALALGTTLLYVPVYEPWTPGTPSGVLLPLVALAIFRTISGFGFLILLGLLLRRELAALAVLVAIVAMNTQSTFITFDANHWRTWLGCGVLACLVVFTIARFGLVTTLAAHFTAMVIYGMPLTVNPEPWYSRLTILSAGVIVALAVYGFMVSLGGQKLIPDEL